MQAFAWRYTNLLFLLCVTHIVKHDQPADRPSAMRVRCLREFKAKLFAWHDAVVYVTKECDFLEAARLDIPLTQASVGKAFYQATSQSAEEKAYTMGDTHRTLILYYAATKPARQRVV